MKKKSLLGLAGFLLVVTVIAGIIITGCPTGEEVLVPFNPGTDDPGGGRGDLTQDSWVEAWAGYSKDNLPPPSYWNNLGENRYWPNPFVKIDGTTVATLADWEERYQEINEMMQYYVYGHRPPKAEQTASATVSGNTVSLRLEMTGPNGNYTYTGNITLPSAAQAEASGFSAPWPLSWGGGAADLSRGFATMSNPSGDGSGGAAGVNNFNGVYSMFGYTRNALNAPSGLMVTSWMCGQIIDAIEELTKPGQVLEGILAPDKFTISGVSRWGKDAIVAAAFEPRIGVSNPCSSGAMGLGPDRFLWTYANPVNEKHLGNPKGKGIHYLTNTRATGAVDDTGLRQNIAQYLIAGTAPPSQYYTFTYPNVQSIQGYDHGRYDGGGTFASGIVGYWATQRFGEFISFNKEEFWTSENGYQGRGTMNQVPFDQHYLAALMAGPDPENPRGLLMSASYNSDTWQNPEGQQMVFWAAREVYRFLGKEDLIKTIVHDQGHARSAIGIQQHLDLCDYMWRDVALPTTPGRAMRTDKNGEVFGPGAYYPLDVRSMDDYQYLNWARPAGPNGPEGKPFSQEATEYFQRYTRYEDLEYPDWWPYEEGRWPGHGM